MPGQRATVCRPPGRRARGGVVACAGSAASLALLVPLALAPPALAAPGDLPPWNPTASSSSPPPAASSQPPPASSSAAPSTAATSPGASTSPAPAATPGTSHPPASPAPTPPGAPDPAISDLPPVPSDPNDAPFMRAPNGQVQTTPPRTRPDLRQGWSARRRLALTLAPAFASLRLPFQNRLDARGNALRHHGAGVDIELDAQIWRWIWLRAQATYSGHPVDEARTEQNDKSFRVTAPAGTIHVTGFGAGPVFALDLGRFLPLIEVGLGGMRVATPNAEGSKIVGLRGEACRPDGSCDVGLRCSAARTCEPTIMPELYFGGAVDLLVRRHLSFGAQFRYYARITSPGQFPLYLLGTLRISVRF